ncbi:hypothetical protein BGZ47_006077 [Haplosporangium gracile]|nr:hypothetical protein BGZ47_006077 [Haplosporangium gracile]
MARSGSPAKSKSTAVIVDESKESVDAVSTTTTTTTTTTVTVVDEETVVAASSFEDNKKEEEEEEEEGKRELPIFNNPLLADEKSSAVALKPKTGRVKVQGGKPATIAVLKMSAPKVNGEVVVMRRMDSNLLNATLMFQAAFPAATEQWITKENSYLAKTYEPHGAVIEDSESGSLAGVWVTVSQAKELAKEYSIEQFMLPLLNAPARKNTIKAAASSSSSPSTEVVAKEEQQTAEETVTAAAVVVVEKFTISSSEETVVVEETTEVVTEEKIVETLEVKEVEEVEVTKENVEVEEKEEKNDQEQGQEQEWSTGSKRGRDEDDEQAAKDRKRFRGFVTVAVGLAAVAVTIPQVLPYFS